MTYKEVLEKYEGQYDFMEVYAVPMGRKVPDHFGYDYNPNMWLIPSQYYDWPDKVKLAEVVDMNTYCDLFHFNDSCFDENRKSKDKVLLVLLADTVSPECWNY